MEKNKENDLKKKSMILGMVHNVLILRFQNSFGNDKIPSGNGNLT